MKRIKSEILVQDLLQSPEMKPVYSVNLGQKVLIANHDGCVTHITCDDQCEVPMIQLNESFDDTYRKRKVHPLVDEYLDKLIHELYLSSSVKRITAPTYLEAHKRAMPLLADAGFGHIFVKDTKTVKEINYYDFERRIFSASYLPKHVLMFVADSEFLGVLPISHNKMSFGAAILVPENAVVVTCESV